MKATRIDVQAHQGARDKFIYRAHMEDGTSREFEVTLTPEQRPSEFLDVIKQKIDIEDDRSRYSEPVSFFDTEDGWSNTEVEDAAEVTTPVEEDTQDTEHSDTSGEGSPAESV